VKPDNVDESIVETTRYPIGFAENPGLMTSPRDIREGVTLDRRCIQWESGGSRPYRDIASIQLWPFAGDDGPPVGRCDIRFVNGDRLRILSMGRMGAITRERDTAYGAFLCRLHAELDEEARARIAFLDGIQGGGAGLMLILALFGGPPIFFSLYAAFTRGPIWLLGLAPALAAITGFSFWYKKRPRQSLYTPDCLPAGVLPNLPSR